MSLVHKLLRPVAALAASDARRHARAFVGAQQHVRQVQDHLLTELIAQAGDSQFARDHSLASVRTYADFVKAVPVRDYEALRPYMQRVLEGDNQALFAPGTEVLMFAVTSGTTGQPKHIPVTRAFLEGYHRGWNIFGVMALDDHRDAWLRKIVTITSRPDESLSPCRLPCGAISGLLADTQKWVVRRMYPVKGLTRQIDDPLAKYYAILRCCIASDVGIMTTANPSSLIRLAEIGRDHAQTIVRDVRDGTLTAPGEMPTGLARQFCFRPNRSGARFLDRVLQRHGQLLPKYYWKLGMLGHWTGGTLGLYLPRVRELYGDVPIRDIGLLATEGRFSLPMQDLTPQGVAEITSNFLEFIPAGQIESPNPDVVRVDELVEGEEYFILPSNFAGLWRYHIDDRVRCTGHFAQGALIEFLSKGLHTCSMTGEKLTEHQVVQAMQQVRTQAPGAETFELQGHFGNPPAYRLRVEAAEGLDLDELAARLDAALSRINIEYASKRSSCRLGGIVAQRLERGSFAQLEIQRVAQRRGRGEQYKHKYLLTDVVNE